MSYIKFSCPYCNQMLDCVDDIIGKNLQCPKCNGNIIINISKNNKEKTKSKNIKFWMLLFASILAINYFLVSKTDSPFSSDFLKPKKISIFDQKFHYYLGGNIEVQGKIKNISNKPYNRVIVNYSFFNSNNEIIGSGSDIINGLRSKDIGKFYINPNLHYSSLLYAELNSIQIDNGFVDQNKEFIDAKNVIGFRKEHNYKRKIYTDLQEAIKDGKITKESAGYMINPWNRSGSNRIRIETDTK